ncbi:putative Chitin synthase-domain-containing protein [Seiridium unicorne]|uniref:Chitin synthase-domain-containing protein n=1 Tax=Seiridium unicorne TaxID=138068 RepID=A0ABR2UFT4_9PEZI
MEEWLSQLWLCHADTLEGHSRKKRQQLSRLLFSNTRVPPRIGRTTTPSQWVETMAGMKIRWGCVGMIIAYLGQFVLNTKESDLFFRGFGVDRETLLNQIYDGTELCLSFCRECNAIDDMFVWLLQEAHILASEIKGICHYESYRIVGELVGASIAMGLHEKIETDARTPFFLAELRKRFRATVYMDEINRAAFLGRPPRLSYRHWNLDPPLDLADPLVLAVPEQLAFTEAGLDPSWNSWNNTPEGTRYFSLLSSQLDLAMRREEIMDLALGRYGREEMVCRADVIQQKIDELIASLPESTTSSGTKQVTAISAKKLDTLFDEMIYQSCHTSKLLLQRVLIRRAGIGPAGLVQAAQTTLRMFVTARQYQDLKPAVAAQYMNFFALHGVRSAVILAIEFLKQEQLPVYPTEPLLPRSRTIQDLSVLVAKFSSFDPTLGLAPLYTQGREVISRILDKILSPPLPATENQPSNAPGQEPNGGFKDTTGGKFIPNTFPGMDEFALDFDIPYFGSDRELGEWLENMSWEQPTS